MQRYRVTTLMEWPASGRRFPMSVEVSAPSARDAITAGAEQLKADGWPGPFRFSESENLSDGHDVWKSSW